MTAGAQQPAASIGRATLAGAGADAAVALASFFAIPYLIARLGVVDFGIVTLLAVAGGQLAIFHHALAVAVTRRIAEARGRGERERLAAGVRATWAVALLVGLVTAGAAGAIGAAAWSSLPGTAGLSAGVLLPAAALTLAAQPLFGVAQALLFGAERFDLAAGTRAAFFLARIGAGVAAVALGYRLAGVLYAQAAVDAGAAVLLYAAARRGAADTAARAELFAWMRSLSALALPLAGANLAQALLLDGEKLLLSALVGVGALTYYAVPFTMGFRILMLAPALGGALHPRLARLAAAGQSEGARQLARRWTRLTLAPASALLAALVALAPELLAWWLGADFAAAARLPARALAVGLFAIAATTPANALLRALLDPRALRRLYALQIVPYALLAALLIQRWGIAGAAVAWSTRAALDAAAILRLARRPAGAPLIEPALWLAPLLGLAVFAGVCELAGDALAAPARAALAAAGTFAVAASTLRGEDLRVLRRAAEAP